MRLKRLIVPTLLAAGFLAGATAALAAGGFGLNEAVKGTGIPQTTNIASLIGKILQTVLGFVGTLFLLLMVYAGFIYMTARGDEKKVGEAKKMIVGAIIGVVIIAGAYALTSFVLTAVTGAASGSQTSGTTPISSGQQGDTCAQKSCHSGSDCNNPPDACYTGTCLCSGEGDPTTGGTTPCTIGFCTLVNETP